MRPVPQVWNNETEDMVESLALSILPEQKANNNGKNGHLTRNASTSRGLRSAKHPGTGGKNEAKLLRDRRSDSQRSLPREEDATDVCFASQPGRAQQVSEIVDRERPPNRRYSEQDLQGNPKGIAVPESLPRLRGRTATVQREGASHEVLPQFNTRRYLDIRTESSGSQSSLTLQLDG